jgi:hypothetical protein
VNPLTGQGVHRTDTVDVFVRRDTACLVERAVGVYEVSTQTDLAG